MVEISQICEGVEEDIENTSMGICSSSLSRPDTLHGQQTVVVEASGTSPVRRARGQVENTLKDLGSYLPLYKAAVDGKWREARSFFDQDPEALTAKITIASETALHIAVGTGKGNDFVEKLVKEMSPEDLALTDQHGETAFSVAAVVGNIEAAKILLNKNPDLPNISGKYGFPIHKAAQFCHKDMVLYLLDVTRPDIQPNPFTGEIGGRLLIDVIAAEFYDIALKLIKLYPEIATVELNGFGSPLSVLARKSTAFASGRVANHSCWRYLNPVIYFRETNERNAIERQALELVKGLCKEIIELDDSKVFSLLQQALHDAAKIGIPEIIEEIVETFPPAIWFTDEDNYNLFQLAMLNRRENVFNLIYQMTDFRFLITRFIDSEDNNMLHLVGRLPPSDRLSFVSGPALLVQREMQWFKQVSKHIHPAQKMAKNKEGKTPQMVFREAHQQLMKDGAKWMKHTASSSAVFATLIATVAFAGGMHVPGGNNTDGLPLLLHQRAFTIFAVADAVSLLLSVISILTFLSIITSRYSEDDFLSILPRRLMIGIGVLFCSITIMMLAFVVALYLLFRPSNASNRISLVLYAIMIVILLMSLPILYQIVRPINGSGMFGKKRVRTLH
ncbi:uncharacterized protein LOC141602439 [Silene latifolia]|uniref:uncharacterized protein LOC141602439 n=1 Tax=Silene latifolia TaxID=37657 RepID=UPI003D7765FD